MRFVKEKHQPRLVRVTHFRQLLKQLGQQPQQKCRIQLWCLHQFIGRQNIDIAVATGTHAHEIKQIQRRLSHELASTLLLQHQQASLNRTDGCAGDVAVFKPQLLCIFAGKGQQGTQVFQIQQQQSLVICDLEDGVDNAFLGIIQIKHARQ